MSPTNSAPLVQREMVRRGLLGIHPGLSRMEAICHALGHPEEHLGRTVHVAGTNGKGSVCAFIDAMMGASGAGTALFTSPHLVDIGERVRINGRDIPPADFDRAAREVLAAERSCSVSLTGFEFIAAAGFIAMAASNPHFSVIEVGMGGRLDATNVVRPTVTVITPIGMDHMTYLGGDIAAIAGEKAGIVKEGVPCISAEQVPEARDVISRRCAALSAPLTEAGIDFRAWGGDGHFEGQFEKLCVGPVELTLHGSYQQENAAVAVAAASHLLGSSLTAEIAHAGLTSARWPGRFQLITYKDRSLLLDGAHNPHAMARLWSSYWDRFDHRPDVLLAVKEDKDAQAMTAILARTAGWVVCTTTGGVPSVPPATLARLMGNCPCVVEPDPATALDLLVAREGNNVAVCCGSFYLIGALLKHLGTATENNP